MTSSDEWTTQDVIAEADEAVRQAAFQHAVDLLRAALTSEPDNVDLLIRLGQAARMAGNQADSLRALQHAATLEPDQYDVLYQLGLTLREEGDIWGALAAQTRLVELDPDDDVRFELARTHTMLGRPDRALPEIESVIANDPARALYRVGHAATLNRLGRHTEAIVVLEQVLDRYPRMVSAWLELAEANRRLQQTSAWVDATRTAGALDPDTPSVQTWLSDVAVLEGRPADAVNHLGRALELHPRFSTAHIGLGAFAWNAGDLDAAESWLESAAQIAPWDGRVQGMLAQFRAETGRGQLDLDRLESEALALPYGRLPFYLGQLYLQIRGDAERAARFLKVAVDHAPEDVEALTMLGEALLLQQEPDDAEQHVQRAIDLSPEYGAAWSGLGFVLRHQDRLPEAVDAFARAATLLPDQANVRQAHGVTLLDLGRVQEALPELRVAAVLEPENGKVLFSLARGLEQAGERDEALATARRARALLPDDPQIAELAGRLEAGGEPSQAHRDNGHDQDWEDQRR